MLRHRSALLQHVLTKDVPRALEALELEEERRIAEEERLRKEEEQTKKLINQIQDLNLSDLENC